MIPKLCANGHRYTGHRCSVCVRAREAQRGTPAQRGYGRAHQQARRALAATLPCPCGYCDRLITPAMRWVAAHVVDGQPEYGWMVAHPDCNERAKRRGGAPFPRERRAADIPASSNPIIYSRFR